MVDLKKKLASFGIGDTSSKVSLPKKMKDFGISDFGNLSMKGSSKADMLGFGKKNAKKSFSMPMNEFKNPFTNGNNSSKKINSYFNLRPEKVANKRIKQNDVLAKFYNNNPGLNRMTHDFDGDGVMNILDCDPLDKFKQDEGIKELVGSGPSATMKSNGDQEMVDPEIEQGAKDLLKNRSRGVVFSDTREQRDPEKVKENLEKLTQQIFLAEQMQAEQKMKDSGVPKNGAISEPEEIPMTLETYGAESRPGLFKSAKDYLAEKTYRAVENAKLKKQAMSQSGDRDKRDSSVNKLISPIEKGFAVGESLVRGTGTLLGAAASTVKSDILRDPLGRGNIEKKFIRVYDPKKKKMVLKPNPNYSPGQGETGQGIMNALSIGGTPGSSISEMTGVGIGGDFRSSFISPITGQGFIQALNRPQTIAPQYPMQQPGTGGFIPVAPPPQPMQMQPGYSMQPQPQMQIQQSPQSSNGDTLEIEGVVYKKNPAGSEKRYTNTKTGQQVNYPRGKYEKSSSSDNAPSIAQNPQPAQFVQPVQPAGQYGSY